MLSVLVNSSRRRTGWWTQPLMIFTLVTSWRTSLLWHVDSTQSSTSIPSSSLTSKLVQSLKCLPLNLLRYSYFNKSTELKLKMLICFLLWLAVVRYFQTPFNKPQHFRFRRESEYAMKRKTISNRSEWCHLDATFCQFLHNCDISPSTYVNPINLEVLCALFRTSSLELRSETRRRQQEEEGWYRQQQLLLEAEQSRRELIAQEEQKLADQRVR